jgi:hypothetical protein
MGLAAVIWEASSVILLGYYCLTSVWERIDRQAESGQQLPP